MLPFVGRTPPVKCHRDAERARVVHSRTAPSLDSPHPRWNDAPVLESDPHDDTPRCTRPRRTVTRSPRLCGGRARRLDHELLRTTGAGADRADDATTFPLAS